MSRFYHSLFRLFVIFYYFIIPYFIYFSCTSRISKLISSITHYLLYIQAGFFFLSRGIPINGCLLPVVTLSQVYRIYRLLRVLTRNVQTPYSQEYHWRVCHYLRRKSDRIENYFPRDRTLNPSRAN